MSSPTSSESVQSRLREIDAWFSSGGLEHSRRKRGSAKVKVVARAKPAAGKPSAPSLLCVPQWAEHEWLAHGFSTRSGGVSTAYRPGAKRGELNLGFTAADARENVEKNRELFLRAVIENRRKSGTKSSRAELLLLHQIHSGLIHRVVREKAATKLEPSLRGDGWITNAQGKMLAIQTADCIPVLVADVRQRVVAAFHAGWRGTVARIVERGVGRMRAEFGSRPEDLTAAIGPGIGSCCYAVGEELRMEFSSQFAYADELFSEVFDLDPVKQKYPMLFLTARAPGHSNLGPSIHLNLVEANRRQLLDAGLPQKNIHAMGLCTACNTEQFFSHRAEQGFTGRMLSVIGVVN